MSQSTVVVVDGTGLEVLEYINEAFNTVITNNSGSSAPTETYAFMLWADTTNDLLKIRNAANTDWITVGILSESNLGLVKTDDIGTSVQAYDSDLQAISSSNAGDQIVSYGVNGIGFKNRIINGDMKINQRDSALYSINNAGLYTLDRWAAIEQTDGSFTVQQSSVAPTGFSKSLLVTVASADSSLGAAQHATIGQPIEGFSVSDLGWGAAGASTVTLSFWVRSSVTGNFGGALSNGSFVRSYPFTYTISSANTWEQKTIVIPGDTTGTWYKEANIGIALRLGLGVGSTYSGTAGSWASADRMSATGSTNLMATNGATFYITGVQLEKGSTATPFEFRAYTAEEFLCKRYYQRGNFTNMPAAQGGAGTYYTDLQLIPTMRAVPSATYTAPLVSVADGSQLTVSSVTLDNQETTNLGTRIATTTTPYIVARLVYGTWQASAEL